MGWKALATTVLDLYCLREWRKIESLCAPCHFLVVSGAWGEQADLSQSTGGSLAFRLGCSCHSIHRRTISILEGESFLGLWLPAVLVFAQMISVLSSLTPGEPQWRLCALHSHGALAAGSRASRAVWALSHWEFCHLNSSACFGSGKRGILDRRPALFQFALPHPLQSWKTARSNFLFLKIHLQEKSMAANG